MHLEPSTSGPRFLYLHGFASGPHSSKGVALAAHFERRGARLERLDLRRPSLEHLRLSVMMQTVREHMGDAGERVVLLGSSLGGLCASRVAEEDARVCALVLLAPAFRFVERWQRRLGDDAWLDWQTTGWLAVEDHAEQRAARVDFAFAEDAAAIDARSGGWPDVRVPTLIVHGRGDEVVDVALSREWAKGKAWVRLVEVDDGHELVASLPRIADETDRHLAPFFAA